jgi:mono/diheme cytochrome c family protein
LVEDTINEPFHAHEHTFPCPIGLLSRRRGFFDGTTIVAQQTRPGNPALILGSVAGHDLFEFYCATCHGRDGKGNGPAAGALRMPPPDLTTIASRNGGVFPRARVEGVVTGGRAMPPAWLARHARLGPIFRGLDPNDRLNRVRIDNIVEYLAAIQTK